MQFKNNTFTKILSFSLVVIASILIFQNCGQFKPLDSQKVSNSNNPDTQNPDETNPGTLPPTDLPNHPILYGYYYADGRYGNFLNEVSDFTNLYVAIPKGYLTETDWRPQFRSS